VSLVDAVRRHAARTPDAAAFTFLERGEREAGSLDYGRLDLRARAVAAHLQVQGAAGEPVALALPTGLGFVEAFFGCLYAGAIAVPMPDAQTRRGAERAQAIRADCGARLAVEPGAAPDALAAQWRGPAPGAAALALLQYTSGSTAAPRGVMVTHGALSANIEAIAAAFALDRATRGVNWLPLYHDMGLIAGVAAPAALGVPSVLLPPLAFLQNPLRWLRAISSYRGTTSGAPSFAYELCARALERRPPGEALDLSCWKVAFCGGEPVRAETLERFARAAAPSGFARGALLACYGLAEATLLVSASRPGAGVAQVGGRVDCGAACAGTQIELGADGEILVRGPAVTAGYWKRAEASRELFRDGFLRTGDLGQLHQGRLVVTGRLKDLVVIRGENHHPEDIEMSVRRAHAALGAGVAFSVDGPAGEELVLVHELAGAAPVQAIAEELAAKVAAQVAENHGLALRELVLIRPMTLPRTANGKLQRGRCRSAYLEGALAVLARVAP